MNKRYQGGSLVGFIVVGVLLALVLIGGLYGLNRYNDQKAAETATTEEGTNGTKSSEVAQNEPKQEEKRQETPADKPQPAPEKSSDQTQQGGTVNDGTGSSEAPNNSSNLPQTGPADTLMQLAAVTALAFAGTAYARSRRRV